MKVTALKKQAKSPDRISVFVDEKYSFSLSLDEVIRHKIKNGAELDEAEVKKLKKISEDGKTAARALAWVLSRPHSSREFMDYLRRKKVAPELAEQLKRSFMAKNYLNDEEYGHWLVDVRSRSAKSNRAIKFELLAKGISREMAEGLLAKADDEAVRLRELVKKKKNLSRYKNDRLKFMQYLTSQGFSYRLVRKELDPNSNDD